MPQSRRIALPWWVVPATVTVLLLAFNSPWYRTYYGRVFRANQDAFGLFVEMNFAVWWSAVLYLLSALLFYEIASAPATRRRRAYAQLSLLMLAVVIDEIGSLHEWVSGLGGWPALAPFGLVGLFLLGDSLRRLWDDRDSRRTAWLVLIAFALFASVALQEYAEHNLTSLRFTRRYGRFFEEGTELVAAWILIVAAVRRRQGHLRGSLAAVVPDPARMARLLPILVVALVPHLAVAQAELFDVGTWDGVPAAVYPTVVFLLLACYAYWVPRHRPEDGSRSPEVAGFWSGVGLFFLVCSVGVMQNLVTFFGEIPGVDKRMFHQAAPLWAVLVAAVWGLGLALWRRRDRRTLWLLAAPLVATIHLFTHHPASLEIALGMLACLSAVAVMRPDGWAAPGASIESPTG